MYSPAVPTALAGVFNFDFPVSIFISILVQPQSRGTVSLRSANPHDTPIINPNYLQEQADVETLVKAVELARELMNTKSFAEYYDGEIVPGPDADLEKFVRGNASTIWHPVGTCKMGCDNLAVVDPALKVHGLEGLRVADASIMPTTTSGNTYAASVMIGEKLVDMVLAD
jgi:choline dehydrogenase